jgi:gliding motility-associated-like protein
MKRSAALLLLLLHGLILSATHNRAGEITYVQISDLTYEITITTFTYTKSIADRQELDVNWGDNSISTASRINGPNQKGEILPNYYKKNIYKIRHTYAGSGVYKIVVQDPNRNFGVRNIPNSVNVVFAISTILTVNPAMGRNSTPVLLNPPYDKAALGYIFIHNPAAFDPDGDSLSYRMTVCEREDGKPIENFTLPPATHYIRVDSVSGDLIWNTPGDTGIYNVAMLIEEWRNGKKIGTVERDMQIEVFETRNKPPVNVIPKDMCVQAGDNISFYVSATDANNDFMTLKATSGVFALGTCPAEYTKVDSVKGYARSIFTWTPCFQAVRNQPYNIVFKADDNNGELMLSDIDNMTIKVLGPPPLLLNAVPEGKTIRLTWSGYGTTAIAGFNIYRREGASTFTPDSCTAGIPASTGFVKIGYIAGSSSVSYIDTGSDPGLSFGKEYTYRIVAVFQNGAESISSNEITSTLVAGIPVIKNVSIISTHQDTGSMFIAWKKPRIDTIPGATGPYEYLISRAPGIIGTGYTLRKSILTADLNDTVFVDTMINTIATGYIYKIELWNRTPGNEFMIPDPGFASSIFIALSPGDRKTRFVINRNVPWINTRYDLFRYNETTSKFDSIGSTNQLTFTDNGLENGKTYRYFARSTGGYLASNMPKNLINFSQEANCTPVDNEPPCPPALTVNSQCESLINNLTWSVVNPECFADIAGYKIYYKKPYSDTFVLDTVINDKNIFSFEHKPDETVAGCYAISAFDLLDNEGDTSQVCINIDPCNFYEIPNVFTPNNDSKNDILIAKKSGLVKKVDFKLYNRNGLLIFSTEDPDISWDGTYKGRIVSPGVYFYQCYVFEGNSEKVQFHLSGFVHVITVEGAKVKPMEAK